jgi:hypothetical protein
MTDGLSAVADEAIRSMMVAGGWTSSMLAPARMLPWEGRYYRELPGGWAAVASVSYADRDPDDDGDWRPGSCGVLMVSSGITFPAAERAAALLGARFCRLAVAAEPAFGDVEGEVEIADRAALLGTIERVATYLAELALPWAQEHANLEAWRTATEGESQGDGDERYGRAIPAMLVAQGRPEDALAWLSRLTRGGSADHDPDQRAFELRLRAFVADGAVLPESGAELFAPPPLPEVDPSLFEDAGRDAFFAAMEEELRSTPAWSQWKYTGGLALRGIRAVRELFDDEPTRRSFAGARWRSVAYRAEDEAFLAAAFAGAGRPVASRVDLELTLRPVGSEAVDVVLGGRVVGRLTPADLHADVEALSAGPAAARLTEKPRAPRYLLEVQLQRVL